jgi:polyribonucleotide nucleotidyltransferase
MFPNVITKKIHLKDGREITLETGKLAKQADGSVVVRMGNTMLLATVVATKDAREGIDFLPLSVDYQEKFASAGKIPGGFLRREGKLSDNEVLISRLIDRVLRPMFPDDYHADVQVMVTMISADPDNQPDAIAGLAAAAALAVSDIPFNGPISEVRVIRKNGEFLINPKPADILLADIDLMVGASYENIIMVEGEMSEVSESEMLEALKVGHEAIKEQCLVLKEFEKAAGKEQKREYSHEYHDTDLYDSMYKALYAKAFEVAGQKTENKNIRKEKFKAIKDEYIASLSETPDDKTAGLISTYYHKIEKEAVRNVVLDKRYRLDGRALEQIRNIWCEVDYLPSAHGSSVFTRGETQSLTSVTLGTKLDEQLIDSALISGTNKFMLHYNFPGFSTGEVKPNRGPGRREIGHGNLAFRALKKMIPSPDKNPYTIRIVSDILESNGSSSMATVCAGTLALMDAGVKIQAPVSGIAMGLISDSKSGKYAVLSDILGDEDHLGDMDFKVCGTSKGITACQMDMKVEGLSYEILSQALEQAKEGRLHILNKLLEALPSTREDLKSHAPRSHAIIIPRDMIGAVIGPGGKVVQEIQKVTGATVVIEETEAGGKVSVFAKDQEMMDKAVNWIKGIVAIPEVDEVYSGKVKSIMPFGAFVEFMPGKDGLLHISEIKWERLENMEGVLEVGEEVKVKLIEVDKKTGKYRLSRKVLLPRPERNTSTEQAN